MRGIDVVRSISHTGHPGEGGGEGADEVVETPGEEHVVVNTADK